MSGEMNWFILILLNRKSLGPVAFISRFIHKSHSSHKLGDILHGTYN